MEGLDPLNASPASSLAKYKTHVVQNPEKSEFFDLKLKIRFWAQNPSLQQD